LFLLLLTAQAWADTAVVFPAQEQMVDLSQHGTRVAAQRRNVALEVPGESDGARMVLDLRATGPGPEYYWTVYTVTNGDTAERDFVFAIDDQRFTASGYFNLQPMGPQAMSIIWAGGATATPIPASGRTAYGFRLKPSSSITFGVEGPAALSGVRVFDQQSFARDEAGHSLLRSGALAIAGLLAAACLIEPQVDLAPDLGVAGSAALDRELLALAVVAVAEHDSRAEPGDKVGVLDVQLGGAGGRKGAGAGAKRSQIKLGSDNELVFDLAVVGLAAGGVLAHGGLLA
jgi:hypothetical protein